MDSLEKVEDGFTNESTERHVDLPEPVQIILAGLPKRQQIIAQCIRKRLGDRIQKRWLACQVQECEIEPVDAGSGDRAEKKLSGH